MGEADAEVNLVAGGESEAVSEYEGEHDYQYRWEGESSWGGTLEAAEAPRETNEAADTTIGQESALCDDSVREGDEMDQCEYESLWVGTIGAMEVLGEAGRLASAPVRQGLTQDDDQAGAEDEMTEDEQWDLEVDQSSEETDGSRNPQHEFSHRPCDGQARASRPMRTSRPGLRTRSGATVDQQWEDTRYNAWLRQLLSDDSSDEDDDEERYGRFAESGRWMSELYGIPQHPTTTSGRECSA
jgi:hypothetical protein